jgi:hypothetical protein
MKFTLLPRFGFLLAAMCVPAVLVGGEITEKELGSFRRPAGDAAESAVADRAKGIVAELAGTASFAKWKRFEDDKVTFSYPDHEAIRVEVKRGEPVPVDGDRVSDVDTSFSRAYRISAGGETLLVLMYTEADWLDDGVCFCGEVVYDRYLVRSGNLYRFSFLESGVMKKMQVLGDVERVMMFEWTHLPMHPAVYREIARSVTLKKSGPWMEPDCRKRVLERYGPQGAVGWFDEGSSVEEVVKVLGKATRAEGDRVQVWDYPKEDKEFRWVERLSLPFADGKLARFESGYFDSAWNKREAIKGGVSWMKETAAAYEGEGEGESGDEPKKMPAAVKAELLAMFIEKAQDKEEDFDLLCQVMMTLVEQGVRDEKALKIVRERFAAEGGHHAAWVLHEAGDPADVSLFVDKIREVYRNLADEPDAELQSSDLHNWLSFIPDEDDRYPDLLREGLRSRNDDVRETAFGLVHRAPFPEKERLAFIHGGLGDADAMVRYWSACCFDGKNTTGLDWELLRKAFGRETDKSTLKRMREVLEKHDAQKGASAKKGAKAGKGRANR